MRLKIHTLLLIFILTGLCLDQAAGAGEQGVKLAEPFPPTLESYQDDNITSTWDKLVSRAQKEPFNVVASVIFLCAIIHTFMAGQFMKLAHHYEHEHQKELSRLRDKANLSSLSDNARDPVSFKATLCHFLGEVEAVFGIWLIPLILSIIFMHDWSHVLYYFDHVNFSEPLFVIIIMAIASTKPVIKLAEFLSSKLAALGGSTTSAWWFSILTIVPLLGSFITEPAAMTIAATLLAVKFYQLKPSPRFMYATLGALFVNISVGGTLTHFAAPPVVMVASKWEIDTLYMLQHFGWKAVLGILIINIIYFFIFRKEFKTLNAKAAQQNPSKGSHSADESIPVWITLVHLAFMAWTVFNLHHPPLVLGGFLFFLAFVVATEHHQYQVGLRTPLLVGFFLAALVSHGGFQSWWLAPVLSGLGELPLYFGATILTSFNDNAAITYLASLVPSFDPHLTTDLAQTQAMQYAVLAGAVTGGGLTVIANAPNPAGQSILNKHFPEGISPLGLFLGALLPTVVIIIVFLSFKSV
jgi:Na+/H+ antiporter NhaD/arsenite permease-like protein